ncbi:putative hexokinase HXK1 [Nadsonia fulvescens var. elongata DSM 6958]|uniref:Phosphotransferase n=1 Tax=Nadsonia fulvescens var. elongata DSM 6958 TaxID=857566 RepID=A0A1E3PLI5_9ASCO|nr:putative hexokinase HXK1 [Nadsonia fulvescens var. elongata DSM 6958]
MVHLGPKKPPSRKGSMNDMPRNLLEEIEKLEKLFTVDTQKLKDIVAHFIGELGKGLATDNGTIPMYPTWVMDWPDGTEEGVYLALDLGGTNLRVVEVKLDGKRAFDVMQSKYMLPAELKVGSSDALWDYIAECLGKFIHDNHFGKYDMDNRVALGFTFSYPLSQDSIDQGVLRTWTKGFDIDGVEGHDVRPMIMAALERKQVPIDVCAIINDTTGTMIASNYTDPETRMGLIFGTGCNAAYMETVKNIPKLKGLLPDDIDGDTLMAINCEWGGFDNENIILPKTKWDRIIDEESPRPGEQSFEKMVAGLYLGEVLRLVLLDLYTEGFIFQNENIEPLREAYKLDSSFLSMIEEDPWENLSEVEDLFLEKLGIKTYDNERKLIRRLAELIGTRAARLSHCGIAAIAKKAGLTSCHAGADGSVVNKYPDFKERGAQAFREIFDWDMPVEEFPIKVVVAEDGSGVGAALIAALTHKRTAKGLSVGIKK